MAVALEQEGAFGFNLQTKQGEPLAPSVWVPLTTDDDPAGVYVKQRRNYQLLNLADGNDFEARYFEPNRWFEGRVVVPLIPGSMCSLLSWIQDRDQDNQGKWATIVAGHVNAVQRGSDVKVRRATFVLAKNLPAYVVLELVGLKLDRGTAAAVTMPTGAPYHFGEAAFELACGGAQLEPDQSIERLTITLDNAIEDPAEAAPQHLYNLAGVRCRATVLRDFVDDRLHADFLAGQEGALRIQLTRGASSCSIALPRTLALDDQLGLPGSHERRIMQTIQLVGLGSTDGLTAPVVLA